MRGAVGRYCLPQGSARLTAACSAAARGTTIRRGCVPPTATGTPRPTRTTTTASVWPSPPQAGVCCFTEQHSAPRGVHEAGSWSARECRSNSRARAGSAPARSEARVGVRFHAGFSAKIPREHGSEKQPPSPTHSGVNNMKDLFLTLGGREPRQRGKLLFGEVVERFDRRSLA